MTDSCRLCGSTFHETVSSKDRHGNPLTTIVCLGCGIITNDPIPSDDELAAFYKSDYRKDYKGTEKPRMRQVWRNFKRLEDHVRKNRDIYQGTMRFLDLGSGSGEFSYLARSMGMDCHAVEPNEAYARYSQDELGLDVATQTLEETEFANGSFDLIRLSHVLEHMRDPVRSLKVLHGWLADDGLLYVEVPNIEAEAARKMQGKMFHFGHIFNFNPVTLRLALSLAGFEELPAVRERNAGTCGSFFIKSDASPPDAEALKANADRMKAAMEAHNSRVIPKPDEGSAVGRFFSNTRQRLSEVISANRFKSYREIAEYFGNRI